MPDPGPAALFTVDRSLCIGSGMCLLYAPATFTQDERATVAVVDPAGDPPDDIRTAVEACPTGALALRPTGGDPHP